MFSVSDDRYDDAWELILDALKEDITATITSTFFYDTELVDINDDTITVYVPSYYNLDVIERNYTRNIRLAVREIFHIDPKVVLIGEKELSDIRRLKAGEREIDSNHDFTFDHFVVGSSNKFAHAAAFAVAQKPAGSYNPLFIYGQSGLGKTHLLYAIYNYIRERNPQMNITYIKGDDFTNELISAIREGNNVEFRQKYRCSDILLVDDIQFIAGKEGTQEEFFHTFNTLYEAKKQIVLTSDRPPKEMNRLEDRLKTRFEWGLLADIQPPDYETRMAIIKAKAKALNFNLSDEIANYIAENITLNIRQLEGTVNKLMAYHDLIDNNLDLTTAARVIKDMYKDKAERIPSPEIIIDETARYFNLEAADIIGQKRNKEIVTARHVAIYITRSMTNMSLPDIGRRFGKRTHTTAMNSITYVENAIKDPGELADAVKEIISNVNSRV